jgi:hypothetical protein
MTALECFFAAGSESISSSLQVDLHKIDPAAQNEVEVGTTQDKGPV